MLVTSILKITTFRKMVQNCRPIFTFIRVISKVSFPIFFLRILWTDQREIAGRYNFWISGNIENYVAITSQKRTENGIENGAAIACSHALQVRVGICFFTALNKSAVEIRREVCSCHHHVRCIDIQLLYAEHNSLLNFNSWLFWAGEKWITVHNSQGVTTHNGSSIFNTAFCTFLWSDCHVIFTVFLKTQKLYLRAISQWSVHKMLRKK